MQVDSTRVGTIQGKKVTIPQNGSRISADNDVSIVDTYTIIKSNGGATTPAAIMGYLARTPETSHIPEVDVDGVNSKDVTVSVVPAEEPEFDDNTIYEVEISWGDMEFNYDFTDGTGWSVGNINSTNNAVTVTNKAGSGAIDAVIDYRDSGNATVKGGFYDTNADAVAAVNQKVFDTEANSGASFTIDKRPSGSAAESKTVYFAFTGASTDYGTIIEK